MRLNRIQLVEGPIGWTLLRLAFPMVWGLLTTMLFGVVDTFFISRLGPTPLAAIGFTFPVVFMVTGTAMGMGIGMTSMVSRAIGEGDYKGIAELTTGGILLTVLILIFFIAGGLLAHDRLFLLLGADPELVPLISEYMTPWFLGVLFLVVPMVGNSALRATGDSLTPSLIMIAAGGLNVILDPLLIFGIGPFPRMELRGAAVATVLAYMLTFLGAFYILSRRERMLLFGHIPWQRMKDIWRRMLHVGLPAVGSNLMVPLAAGVVTRIVAGYGPSAVAAFGVASRIESLAMVGHFAMSTVMAAYAGQNVGAQRVDRVRAGLRFALFYSLTLSLALWALLTIGSDMIASWFTDDPATLEVLRPYLKLVPLSYGLFGFMLSTASAFNASGQPRFSALLFVLRLFVFTVPLALLGSYLGGVRGVFVAIFAANLLSGVIALFLGRRVFRA